MARPSFHPKDTFKGRSDVAEGLTEIIGIKSVINQYNPNSATGEQQAPTTGVLVEFQSLDRDGEAVGEVVEKYYKAGDVTKTDNDNEEVIVLLPSIGDSDEPVENEIGAEGDTFWCQPHWAPNSNTAWSVFCSFLIKCGFNEERVMSSHLPELLGTIGEIKNEQKSATIGGKQTDWNVPVFKSISRYPYDAKKSTKTHKSSSKSKAASGEPDDGGGSEVDADALATKTLMQVLNAKDAEGIKTMTIMAVRRDMMGILMEDGMKMPDIKPINQKLDDAKFMAEAGELIGFTVTGKGKGSSIVLNEG